MRPHKIRYRVHSPEKEEAPEVFSAKVNEICELYLSALEKDQAGIHVVSTDEMTGIHALEHKHPDKPSIPGACATMDFEYIRHGTTSLIGFFDIALGTVYPPYLNQTRTEEDFCKAVCDVTLTDAKGGMNNLVNQKCIHCFIL